MKMGFSNEAKVNSAEEYDKAKEKEGYIAGKHIAEKTKWWFQRQQQNDNNECTRHASRINFLRLNQKKG